MPQYFNINFLLKSFSSTGLRSSIYQCGSRKVQGLSKDRGKPHLVPTPSIFADLQIITTRERALSIKLKKQAYRSPVCRSAQTTAIIARDQTTFPMHFLNPPLVLCRAPLPSQCSYLPLRLGSILLPYQYREYPQSGNPAFSDSLASSTSGQAGHRHQLTDQETPKQLQQTPH